MTESHARQMDALAGAVERARTEDPTPCRLCGRRPTNCVRVGCPQRSRDEGVSE